MVDTRHSCRPLPRPALWLTPIKMVDTSNAVSLTRTRMLWLTPIKMVDTRDVRGYRLLLKKEQREVVSATNQLKLTAPDGKQLRLRNMTKPR